MIYKILTLCVFVAAFGRHQPLFGQQATKQDTLKELMRRIEILTQEIEKVQLGSAGEEMPYKSHFEMGPAASKIYQRDKTGVSISGYGEIVYNNFSAERDDGTPSGASNRIDYLRHITYIGYRFNDWLLFNSEIEFEHAKTGEGAPGEVALEFGYIEATLHPSIHLRAGMLLVPVGIINELHEPSTFHGVLRPETERAIIPATWRANGFGFVGQTKQGINYKIYLTESLNAAKFSAKGIRSGRQNGAEAVAEDLALSGRLTYSGIPGLNFGTSFFIGNTGQTLSGQNGSGIDAQLTLFSFHGMFARRGLEVRALYARSTLDDVPQLNAVSGFTGSSTIGETQQGYYITVAYDVLPHLAKGSLHYLAPFVQFEKLNTQEDVPAGFVKNPALERTNVTLGLTYKPHPNVAFKLDYMNRDNEADSAVDQFNLAVNYLF